MNKPSVSVRKLTKSFPELLCWHLYLSMLIISVKELEPLCLIWELRK